MPLDLEALGASGLRMIVSVELDDVSASLLPSGGRGGKTGHMAPVGDYDGEALQATAAVRLAHQR